MKVTIANLWPLMFSFLCLSMPAGGNAPPVKKLYRFETSEGFFYIVEFKKRFYPMFREELLGGYAAPEDAAADLGLSPSLGLLGVDIQSLRIPADLTRWQRL